TRAEVRAAFLASGAPYAADSFVRVDEALRARLQAWSQAHEEACAATEIRHEQSAALMDAKMACLGRVREQIGAFVGVLRTADARGVERATGAVDTVGDLSACANSTALMAAPPPPRDPRQAAAADALQRDNAHAEALMSLGRGKETVALAPKLIERG